MSPPSNSPEIGRILRSNTAGFAVGCRVNQLTAPSFGALVRAQPVDGQEAIYGLIYDFHIDDDQLIQRLVMTENPRPNVIEDQRQNRMLPLEMSVLTVGYLVEGSLRQGFPPRPPLNLDPVHLVVDEGELRRFSDQLGYFRLILRAPAGRVPVDQLLVAHIRQVYESRGEDRLWAMTAVREVVELLRTNYDLLIPTLEALSAALPDLPTLA